MASWDVFHADSLELERGLSSDAVRAAVAGGALRDDDLVRPAGTSTPWARLGDFPELTAPPPGVSAPPAPPPAPPPPREPAPPREPERRGEPRPTTVEAPGRIRAGRPEAPAARAEPSDFEVRADQLGPAPPPDAPTASTSTAPPPAWLQLGGEPDDVTFPVLPDDRAARGAAPGPPDAEAEAPEEPPLWDWPDDEDRPRDQEPDEDDEEIIDLDESIEILDDDEAASREILDEDGLGVPDPFARESAGSNGTSHVALPVVPSRDWNEDRHPVEGGEEDEDFTFSRSGPMTVEELDLAPMVDVAFQLVLFFMVTATTVLYKTLEIPRPTTDQAPAAVAQGHSRSMDDLQKDYILVEIDPSGAIRIDREPVAGDVDAMAERLRTAREKTGRKIMLLSADYATPHRNAVLAYDAAIEIGMQIAIARPTAPEGPGPSVFPGAARQGGGRPPAASPATPAPPAAAPAPAPTASPAPGAVPF